MAALRLITLSAANPWSSPAPAAARCGNYSFPVKSSSLPLSCSSRTGQIIRGRRLMVRAGPPSTNSLILAFLLPLSLLVGTIFAAARIADRLDEKFLDELAMNEAILEEMDEDDVDEDEDDRGVLVEEEDGVAAIPKTRNRPKRVV
ncbi:uncharacterized protein LOC122012450 [Zingiber officinale]|uniref:uncharacterized protein LOC122012450 n=1 Tax=Zingiber officinale TaxID=94328 RepID=UPI001C4CA78F|nr:uncharacterized protein LOC122012450 [Zingiber officinale]